MTKYLKYFNEKNINFFKAIFRNCKISEIDKKKCD